MDRDNILLAGIAAAGENATFTPVQVQKLFFLLDKEAAGLVQGPHFNFKPYDYGPFDRAVYDGLDSLAQRNLAHVENNGRYRVYSLTEAGFRSGAQILSSFPDATRDYLTNISNWVRKLTFEQLVAAVYNRYPEMKVNSVFRG